MTDEIQRQVKTRHKQIGMELKQASSAEFDGHLLDNATKHGGSEPEMSYTFSRRSVAPYIWFVTLIFAGLPWLIKFVIVQIEHPQLELLPAFVQAYPEFAFIPLTVSLYVVGLAAENYEHIKSRSDALGSTTLSAVGGIISLCSYFIFVEKMPAILSMIQHFRSLVVMFIVIAIGTICVSGFASMLIHKARQVGEERDVR